jgi:hypothetical protein
MSRLYLRCVLCSRQQADGLLSGAGWGRLELPVGAVVHHPAVKGSTARACPSCMSSNHDWQEHVLATLGLSSNAGFSLRVDSA